MVEHISIALSVTDVSSPTRSIVKHARDVNYQGTNVELKLKVKVFLLLDEEVIMRALLLMSNVLHLKLNLRTIGAYFALNFDAYWKMCLLWLFKIHELLDFVLICDHWQEGLCDRYTSILQGVIFVVI